MMSMYSLLHSGANKLSHVTACSAAKIYTDACKIREKNKSRQGRGSNPVSAPPSQKFIKTRAKI